MVRRIIVRERDEDTSPNAVWGASTDSGKGRRRRRNVQREVSVGRQATSLAAATGLAQGLLAVLYIVAARGSAPQDLGSAVSAVALATAGVGFIDFGTNSHWVREIARGTLSLSDFSSRLTAKILIAAGAGLLWTILAALFDPNSLTWTAGPIMLCLLVNQSLQVSLRAQARGDLVAIAILSDRIVALTLFTVLALAHFKGAAVIWICLCFGSIAAAVVGFVLTARPFRPTFGLVGRVNPWRDASFYGLATLANTSQSLDLPILSLSGGAVAAGIYGAVNRWTQPMSLLANAFSTAAAPLISRSGNIVDAWSHLRRAMWMPAAAILLSAGIAVASPLIIEILLGNGYGDSVATLRILAIATIFSVVSQPLSVILQSLRLDRFVAVVLAAAVVVQLALVMILGPSLKATGAAFAYLVVQVLLFVVIGLRVYMEYRRVRA